MMWWGVSLICLALAILVEEGWIWYLMAGKGMDDAEVEDRAEPGRVLSGLFLACFSLAMVMAVVQTGAAASPAVFLGVGGLVIATLGAGLAGASWRSPVNILGRSVLHLFRPVGWVLNRAARGFHSPEEQSWELEAWESFQAEGEAERALATLKEFRASTAEDVMVPREEIAGMPAHWTVAKAVEDIGEKGFSRYPVYSESVDAVIGVLHSFDLVGAPQEQQISELARTAFMTTETKPITSLLRELQQSYNQMAIVVDELGGTAGLVTIEDLLEELVGEIEDETDDPEALIRSLEPGVYWVDASLRIEELNQQLELEIPEGEYDTVAGLVLERLERIPRIGERVRVEGVSWEVLAAEPNRLGSLKMILEGADSRRTRSR